MNRKQIDELLNLGKSREGGWSKAQIEALGLTWPLSTGWKDRLNNVTEDQARKFLELKDKHLPSHQEDMEELITNWGNRKSFYQGDKAPWDFPTFMDCYECLSR